MGASRWVLAVWDASRDDCTVVSGEERWERWASSAFNADLADVASGARVPASGENAGVAAAADIVLRPAAAPPAMSAVAALARFRAVCAAKSGSKGGSELTGKVHTAHAVTI